MIRHHDHVDGAVNIDFINDVIEFPFVDAIEVVEA